MGFEKSCISIVPGAQVISSGRALVFGSTGGRDA